MRLGINQQAEVLYEHYVWTRLGRYSLIQQCFCTERLTGAKTMGNRLEAGGYNGTLGDSH